MAKIKKFLSKWGIHSFLLPVFFVLHNYMQYYGLVSPAVALKIFAEIIAIILLSIFLVLALTKNMARILQIITVTSFVFLFYGVLKDFLGKTVKLIFLTSYTVMLPLTATLTVILYIIIIRKKIFLKINLFQNLLLLVFILSDIVPFVFRQGAFFLNRNMLVGKNLQAANNLPLPSERPDVYFLLFDSYPGTGFLRNYLRYDNSDLDSILTRKGFRVIGHSTSNYNRTAFSLASELNFEYLKGMNNETRLNSKHYNQALLSVEHAMVPEVFSRAGYKIHNLSIFNFADEPPIRKEDFLTSPEESVLLYNTLIERFRLDVGWNFTSGKYSNAFLKRMNNENSRVVIENETKKRDFNKQVIDSVEKIPAMAASVPKFIYAHFYLPHPPYFFTDDGKENDLNWVLNNKSYFSRDLFISYLKYTNKAMLKMVNTLLANPARQPVIIIQSDHSSTDYEGCPDIPDLCFQNYTAIYFPDKNYSSLNDTLSNINTFPLIFNKYFNTHIPMQANVSYFLRY